MRIIAQKEGKPSVWIRQEEVIEDDRADTAVAEQQAIVSAVPKPIPDLLDKAKDVDNNKSEKVPSSDVKPEAKTSVSSEPAKSVQKIVEASSAKEADNKKPEKVPSSDVEPEAKASVSSEHAKSVPKSVDTPASDSDSVEKVEKTELDDSSQDLSSAELEKTAKELKEESKPSGSTATGPVEGTPKGIKVDATTSEQRLDAPGPTKAENKGTAANKGIQTSTAPKEKRQGRSSSVGGKASRSSFEEDPVLRQDAKTPQPPQKLPKVATKAKSEDDVLAEHRAYQEEIEREKREDDRTLREEERAEQRQLRQEKRDYEMKRRGAARKEIENATNLKAMSLTDLNKIIAQNQFVERFSGMGDDDREVAFDASSPRGPSQIVTYTSRFVDRLSDVTDDMCVSGSLSIKAAKIGGSGKGSFVDSDKFKESDLNFYISVKVINHTVNFKDALVFNPLRSVNDDNFVKVFGDSFISGFLEGGEFNALVSMKVLNKAKKTDIKAEAKVAFTAGPIDVTAEANVGIARSNIETNTETTIQVSWSGGGHIKPLEQAWSIKSLMQAAARFPDLVADCPQRIYAILTKYPTLRSFIQRMPAAYTPLQYENAQIYTNALLDSFMSYKALYKRLGEQIFNV